MRPTLFFVLVTGSVLAQTALPPAFEVASIRPVRQGDQGTGFRNVEASADTLRMRTVSITAMIEWAYGIQVPQISGPNWLDSQSYDVFAKAGGPVTDAEMRLMLRALLAERFGFVAHRERKQLTVLVLMEAKGGHKMKESKGGRPGQSPKDTKRGLVVEGISMGEFAEQLAHDVHIPVVDMTGLEGHYDFELNIAAYLPVGEAGRGGHIDPLDIMQTALQKELGLKLESRKAPVEMLVIDHLERSPTEN
jgi:uncharacterized protein (TIGR03435 family)